MNIQDIVDRVGRNRGRHIITHSAKLTASGQPISQIDYTLLLDQPKDYDFESLPEFVVEVNKRTPPDVIESVLNDAAMKRYSSKDTDIENGEYCLLLNDGTAITGRAFRMADDDSVRSDYNFIGFYVDRSNNTEGKKIVGYAKKQTSVNEFNCETKKRFQ